MRANPIGHATLPGRGGGLTLHELVHLYCGMHNGPIDPDPCEVGAFAWWTLAQIEAEAVQAPERLTAWFRIYVNENWPLRPPTALHAQAFGFLPS